MKVCVIALEYLEPEYEETRECLDKLTVDIYYADRKGCGSISKAFNQCFSENYIAQNYDLVWFVTNITGFDQQTLIRLIDTIGEHSAICPVYDSDHPWLRPKEGLEGVEIVPFIEFTCPLVRTFEFHHHRLDEKMPYYHHDLDWSYRVREVGHTLAVHNGVEVQHTYLRKRPIKHPITLKRERARIKTQAMSEAACMRKHGRDWRKKIWYNLIDEYNEKR